MRTLSRTITKTLAALTAMMVVCAAPALAGADPSGRDCGNDPETTGALSADPRSLHLPGERPNRVGAIPPEESWQEEARESAEQRWRDLLACGVD
ncbi:hypothetical protein Q8W71_10195 [Methylobacterium sp. NEAU 140]|uniref:hypothetical protein n=1 Tax=Methylobacterium sp. NEAU 140 TaxID=3064945 RepID=UPI002735C8E6|nr:hypothetical protein [Methylobacterium sp. NEAU 140]MDP4022994.1 hypothetical protein [Methylobacterium sp. NEAU 140]